MVEGEQTAGEGDIDGKGLGALTRLGECHREQREGGGREQGGKDALQGSSRDENNERGGSPGKRGCSGEAGKADEEGGFETDGVRHAAAEKKQTGEGERIGGDDPLAVRIRKCQ